MSRRRGSGTRGAGRGRGRREGGRRGGEGRWGARRGLRRIRWGKGGNRGRKGFNFFEFKSYCEATLNFEMFDEISTKKMKISK